MVKKNNTTVVQILNIVKQKKKNQKIINTSQRLLLAHICNIFLSIPLTLLIGFEKEK